MLEEVKVCQRCHLELPLLEFSVTNKARGYRRGWCRACENERMRAYYAAKPDYQAQVKANAAKWLTANRDRAASHRRKGQLKLKYGIAPEQYAALLAAQGGCCALCGTTEHGHNNGRREVDASVWPIDHNHKTGAVRGLLCHPCNAQLGGYETLLEKAGEAKVLDYLTRPCPVPPLPEVVDVRASAIYVEELPPARVYTQGSCTVCGEPQHAGGLCFKHYMRARRRNGDAGPAETLPHGGSTLTPDDIRAIRAVPDARGVGAKLAAQYGVSQPTISMIRKRRIWTHVADEVAA